MTTRRTFLKTAGAVLAPAALAGTWPAPRRPPACCASGMTASAVPLSNGCPDQGAEGQRFMGITLYDQLVEWDLSQAPTSRPA